MQFIGLSHKKLFDCRFAFSEYKGSKREGNLVKVIDESKYLEYLLIEYILVK